MWTAAESQTPSFYCCVTEEALLILNITVFSAGVKKHKDLKQ